MYMYMLCLILQAVDFLYSQVHTKSYDILQEISIYVEQEQLSSSSLKTGDLSYDSPLILMASLILSSELDFFS